MHSDLYNCFGLLKGYALIRRMSSFSSQAGCGGMMGDACCKGLGGRVVLIDDCSELCCKYGSDKDDSCVLGSSYQHFVFNLTLQILNAENAHSSH